MQVILLAIALVFISTAAQAACTNPAAESGQVKYNADEGVPQYCNGTDWIGFHSATGSSAVPCTPSVNNVQTTAETNDNSDTKIILPNYAVPNLGNRILVATVGSEDSSSENNTEVTSITFGGTAMTVASTAVEGQSGNNWGNRATLAYLIDPPVTTGDIEATFAANGSSNSYSLSAFVLDCVEQQPPEATSQGLHDSGSDIDTNITTLTDGAIVIDAVSVNADGAPPVLTTEFAGQSKIAEVQASGGHQHASSYKIVSPAGLTSLGWNSATSVVRAGHALAAFAQAGPSTVCTNPAREAGTILYNADHHVLQFCNGAEWLAAGPVDPPGAGGGGCTDPARPEGRLIYNADFGVMQYCDGTRWWPVGPFPLCPIAPAFGLMAHWNLDESSGMAAADSAGSNDGALNNFPADPWQETGGKVGGALSFDGTNDYMDAGNLLSSGVGAMTAAAWIRPSVAGDDPRVICKSTGTATGNHIFCLYYEDVASVIRVRLRTVNDSGNMVDSTQTLPLDEWSHIAFTYDGSSIVLYLNGQNAGCVASAGSCSPTGQLLASNQTVTIGNVNTVDSRYFEGLIDDARLYDRALTAQEIQRLYDAGNCP